MERWLPVVEYEGLYEVSDQGRVRSLDRRVKTWFGDRLSAGRVLVPKVGKFGYREIGLRDASSGRKPKFVLVHRLVLIAFEGPPPAGMECRHGNGDNSDCRISNLSWGTHLDNMHDQYVHGTRVYGKRHPNTKLTLELVEKIKQSPKLGTELALDLGVGTSTISRARRGKALVYQAGPCAFSVGDISRRQ